MGGVIDCVRERGGRGTEGEIKEREGWRDRGKRERKMGGERDCVWEREGGREVEVETKWENGVRERDSGEEWWVRNCVWEREGWWHK
jgi:hypothetical protein